MCAAFALVWAAPERGGSDQPDSGEGKKTGNGESAPSTVLVVEDEVLIRFAVGEYLRDCGYRVLETKTGEEAQAIMRAGELVEILFADIDLGPGINGFELARWTRENYRGIRIILASGVDRMADAATDICDKPMMRKPYAYETLADHIKSLLGAMGQRSRG